MSHTEGRLPGLRWWGHVVVVALVAIAPAAEAKPKPTPGTPLTVAELGWPASTLSVATRGRTKVYSEWDHKKRLGVIARGQALGWKRAVATRDRCRAWIEIEPRGWVCARDIKPSDAPMMATEASETAWAIGDYADIRKGGADVFDTVDEIRAGTPTRHVSSQTFVSIRRARAAKVDGVRYYRTDQGYVASDRISRQTPSSFSGLDLAATQPPSWPFAWVSPHVRDARLVVRATPDRDAVRVRELARRDLVPVLGVRDGFVQIGINEWLEARNARVAQLTAPPTGVGATERWVDVDLEQQVLVAYEGKTPVYVTLVSSGRRKFNTPVGVFRIGEKDQKRRMQNRAESREEWNVADVPFAMGFRKMFALHGAYWHDGFGKPRSHGCVNLSPADARRMYDWTLPTVPAGWVAVDDDGGGTPIRIRNRKYPDPPWRDFQGNRLSTEIATE